MTSKMSLFILFIKQHLDIRENLKCKLSFIYILQGV